MLHVNGWIINADLHTRCRWTENEDYYCACLCLMADMQRKQNRVSEREQWIHIIHNNQKKQFRICFSVWCFFLSFLNWCTSYRDRLDETAEADGIVAEFFFLPWGGQRINTMLWSIEARFRSIIWHRSIGNWSANWESISKIRGRPGRKVKCKMRDASSHYLLIISQTIRSN